MSSVLEGLRVPMSSSLRPTLLHSRPLEGPTVKASPQAPYLLVYSLFSVASHLQNIFWFTEYFHLYITTQQECLRFKES